MVRSFPEVLLTPVRGVVAALLPWPESGQVAREWKVDVAWWSLLLGAVQAPSAGLLFFGGAVSAVSGTAPRLSGLLLENWFPELSEAHFMGSGAVALLTWYLHPVAWLLAVEALIGGVRLAAFVASRQPVGEPLVWVVLRVAGVLRRAAHERARARDLGPLRPDRVLRGAEGSLEILSSRDRPEWTAGTTLEVGGRFYRWLDVELRPDGTSHVLAYRWQELDEHEVIRRPVRYEPR